MKLNTGYGMFIHFGILFKRSRHLASAKIPGEGGEGGGGKLEIKLQEGVHGGKGRKTQFLKGWGGGINPPEGGQAKAHLKLLMQCIYLVSHTICLGPV